MARCSSEYYYSLVTSSTLPDSSRQISSAEWELVYILVCCFSHRRFQRLNMAKVGLHLLQTPQVTLLHTLQDCIESELLGHLTIMDNLPPSSPPLFCLRMNEETTLHAQTVYSREWTQISSFVLYWELVLCYIHTCPTPHCRRPRELIQCQTDWGEDSQELCWHWGTVCVKVGWLSAQMSHAERIFQLNVATAIWLVGPTSWGSYCPLGLVAARMVHLVFSLHTSPACINKHAQSC